jgi:F-type H+-transporting ATPase subunit gamma
MPGIKELKTRIKSISGTRKVTRAMQMVSAAKMRKAQNFALQSRTYAEEAWKLITNISNTGSFNHPLILNYNEAKKIGIILITSNRGMVGSLNTNLINKLKEIEPKTETDILCEIITYGKKGSQTTARMGKKIVADFPKLEKTLSAEDVYPIVSMIAQMYGSAEYKKIYLVYNQFVSTLSQVPVAKQLLPFSEKLTKDFLSDEDEPEVGETDFLFEPSPQTVLEHLLPRILESQIYEAILESDASEHSARMVMMKNATEAAGDLIADYTLTYNQLRQGKITTELAEITAGKIALE